MSDKLDHEDKTSTPQLLTFEQFKERLKKNSQKFKLRPKPSVQMPQKSNGMTRRGFLIAAGVGVLATVIAGDVEGARKPEPAHTLEGFKELVENVYSSNSTLELHKKTTELLLFLDKDIKIPNGYELNINIQYYNFAIPSGPDDHILTIDIDQSGKYVNGSDPKVIKPSDLFNRVRPQDIFDVEVTIGRPAQKLNSPNMKELSKIVDQVPNSMTEVEYTYVGLGNAGNPSFQKGRITEAALGIGSKGEVIATLSDVNVTSIDNPSLSYHKYDVTYPVSDTLQINKETFDSVFASLK